MSHIVRNITCRNCGSNYDNLYMSFGHPSESFCWQWECPCCKEMNKEVVIADFDFNTYDNIIKRRKYPPTLKTIFKIGKQA